MRLGDRLDRLRGQAGRQAKNADLDTVRPVSASPDATGRLARALEGKPHNRGFVVCERRQTLAPGDSPPATLSRLPETHHLRHADWVYLDTETTGLSGGVGTLAFMVGVARLHGGTELEVRQYVLAGFSAESAMLDDLQQWLGRDPALVSYNGKCFDLPLLLNRFRLHGLRDSLSSCDHLDLMYGVRRAYSDHWPDCRLQTAERLRLGLMRDDDLPGSQAPAAWQDWLRHGDVSRLRRVLAHNDQDVVSLALLHRALVEDYRDADRIDLDPASVGRAWMNVGCVEQALQIWEQAGPRLGDRGALELAAAYRRQSRWREAESLWLGLHARGSKVAASELSKYHEHHRRDYHQALRFADGCDDGERQHRSRRLQTKIGENFPLPLDGVGQKDKRDTVDSRVRRD